MRSILSNVNLILDMIGAGVVQDGDYYLLPQDIQKKVNGAERLLEEAYCLLEHKLDRDTQTMVDKLFDHIKHGSAEHQEWLKDALDSYFFNLPKPIYKD